MLPEQVKVIEIGLINKCNLKCPMCLRQSGIIKGLKPSYLDINILKNFLNHLTTLERVVLMGSISEPTLYPHLFELIKYLKDRNIKIRLSTNGSTNINWCELGKLLDENDIVRFPVDGSTQELHSKYRVGSKLSHVIANHNLFKSNSKAITIMQHIQFKYNEHDEEAICNLYINSNFDLLELSPCYEPPNLNSASDIMPRSKLLKYQKIKRTNNKVAYCPEYSIGSIYLNHLGILVPCNEQEDKFLNEINIPNIYTHHVNECFNFMNNIEKNKFEDKICIKSCTKMGINECHVFPITQYNKTKDFYKLIDFRECMKEM